MEKIFLVFMLIFVLAGNAYSFEKADLNKDGKIDMKEFEAAVEAKFNEYDKNKNGYIDYEEFNAHKDETAEKEFGFIDRNGDKKINREEFKAAANERFKSFDVNRDGYLSVTEHRSNKAWPQLKLYF